MLREYIRRKMQIISFVSVVWLDLPLSFRHSFVIPEAFHPIDNTWLCD
jgi:hypothetical protein